MPAACRPRAQTVSDLTPVGDPVLNYDRMGNTGYAATRKIWDLGLALVWYRYDYVLEICCDCNPIPR